MADKGTSSPAAPASGESAAATGTPKKALAAKAAKPRAKPTHPKTSDMVNAAILALKERGGSSLQAIKKYMATTYNIDAEKQATFIRKYLKSAVASGILIQTKGKGAAGSFKLATSKVDSTKTKAKPAAKAAKAPKKKPADKKPAAAKKPASPKKAPTKKAAATAAVSEKKKASKGPAAKPPKPKTTKAKPAPKSPAKKAKPASPKKAKPATAKPKKAAPKKAATAKK